MSEKDENDADRGGLGRWWTAAAAVVVVVVLCLAFVLIFPGSSGDKTAGPASSTSPTGGASPTSSAPAQPSSAGTAGASSSGRSTTPTRGSAWADAGCNGHPGSGKAPQKGPGVVWKPLGGMSVPVSSTLGPTKVTPPLRQCFQHSPAGALVAAVNILAGSSAKPSVGPTVLRAQMTPGTARTHAIAGYADPNTSPGSGAPAGFQFGACTARTCQLNLVVQSSGYYLQYSLSMIWTKGDWYLDGSGADITPGLSRNLPGGYVPWQPGS